MLREADRGAFEAHLLSLDPHDRLLRFGTALPDRLVSQIARDYPLDQTTGGLFVRGHLVAAVSIIRTAGEEAELAVSLDQGLRGRGIGRQMVAKALRLAASEGVRKLLVQFLAENRPMAAIANQLPGSTSRDGSERVRTVDLPQWSAAHPADSESGGMIPA